VVEGLGVGDSVGTAPVVAVAVGVLDTIVGCGVGVTPLDAPHETVSATRATPRRWLAAVAMDAEHVAHTLELREHARELLDARDLQRGIHGRGLVRIRLR
jgi:hypothetical protein